MIISFCRRVMVKFAIKPLRILDHYGRSPALRLNLDVVQGDHYKCHVVSR